MVGPRWAELAAAMRAPSIVMGLILTAVIPLASAELPDNQDANGSRLVASAQLTPCRAADLADLGLQAFRCCRAPSSSLSC